MKLWIAVTLALALAAPSSAPSGEVLLVERFAVIVHPSTAVHDVTLSQLRRIFLGEQQFWPGGDRVVLFVHEPGTAPRAVVLKELYRMNEGEFRRYWIAKTFRDDISTGPKIVSSSALAKRLTATIPGAIAVIPAEDIDASVKVLTVESRGPRDDGYVLMNTVR
jgi:hypothetical protein